MTLEEFIEPELRFSGTRKFKTKEEALLYMESETQRLEELIKAGEKRQELERLGIEIPKGDQKIKEIKKGQYLFSPRSYDYLILKTKRGEGVIKMPHFTARQDALIDFIFSRLKKQVEKIPENERIEITHDDFSSMLVNLDIFETGFSGLKFTTTEVRNELNIRYSEDEMIRNFGVIRDKSFKLSGERIWADEDGGYRSIANWRGSIISDVVDVKTEYFAKRTREPLHKIILNIGLVTGILWRNDIIRKKYCLFPANDDKRRNFYRLPEQAQKIFRYLSLWRESTLNLKQFSDILNYKPEEKQMRKFKARIDNYFKILKKRGFVLYWQRVKNTRSWNTKWYIQRLKRLKAKEGTLQSETGYVLK